MDAHQHYWKLSRGDYGWLTPELGPLYRDYGPDELAPLLAREGFFRSIVVQAAPTLAETEYLLDLCEREATLAGAVGWVDLEEERVEETLDRLLASPYLLGIRPMLQDLADDRWIERPRVIRGLRAASERGLTLDVLVRPPQMAAAARALEQVPELRAVLDHIGKPDMAAGSRRRVWSDGLRELAARPRTACKLSGLVTEAGAGWSPETVRPHAEEALERFGPERVLFGSDWPVCLPAAEYGEVAELARTLLPASWSEAQRRDAFGGNAARWYGLGVASGWRGRASR
ncbi:amidohydrolase family protein [Paenibacillus albicereus]|uniref:Amidohydrolase family protein n=1 Tax=Paenibacillus albicereus TaxID=2726185 RepID=A0A6H2H3X0_9BACL|nr:amidohydrolase family protein [Paenibacillus albicereus]